MSAPLRAPSDRGSLWQTVQAVVWAFFGVRRSIDHQRDVERVKPLHVVLVGVAAAAVLVVGIVLLVRWVVGSGVAA